MHVFTWISNITNLVSFVFKLFVIFQYINMYIVPIYVELVSLKSVFN